MAVEAGTATAEAIEEEEADTATAEVTEGLEEAIMTEEAEGMTARTEEIEGKKSPWEF